MNPSRGSLIRRPSISATNTRKRSAVLRTRGLVILSSYQHFHWARARLRHLGGSKLPAIASRRAAGLAAPPDPQRVGRRRDAERLAPRDLLHLEGFDDVAFLDVLVVLEHETALEALP